MGGYFIGDGTSEQTPDGRVDPVSSETVAVPQATLACSGSGCAGATFSLTALDASHAEGAVSGTFQDLGGRGAASVVCSFYLPMAGWAP